jgi:hypothetical protein
LTDNLLGVRVGVAANIEISTSHSGETPPTVGTPVSINRNTSYKRFVKIEFISVFGYLRRI